MTTAIGRLRTGALRTGPIGFDGGESAPLVFPEQAAQLGVLGSKAADLGLAHLANDSRALASLLDFGDTGPDHLGHEPVGKGLICRKLDRSLAHQIVLEFGGVGLRDTVAHSV